MWRSHSVSGRIREDPGVLSKLVVRVTEVPDRIRTCAAGILPLFLRGESVQIGTKGPIQCRDKPDRSVPGDGHRWRIWIVRKVVAPRCGTHHRDPLFLGYLVLAHIEASRLEEMRGLLSFDLCFVGTKDEQPLRSLRRRADRVTARWNPAEEDALTAREIGNLLLAGRRLGSGLRL